MDLTAPSIRLTAPSIRLTAPSICLTEPTLGEYCRALLGEYCRALLGEYWARLGPYWALLGEYLGVRRIAVFRVLGLVAVPGFSLSIFHRYHTNFDIRNSGFRVLPMALHGPPRPRQCQATAVLSLMTIIVY